MTPEVKNKCNYPAIFTVSDSVLISFPDFPSLTATSIDIDNAPSIAKETLGMHLCEMEQELKEFPTPTKIIDIKTKLGQVLCFIGVWMPLYRKIQCQTVKITVEIPNWVYDLTTKNNVDCSAVCERALMEHLGIAVNTKPSIINNEKTNITSEKVNFCLDDPNDIDSLKLLWERILKQISPLLSSPSYETWLTPSRLMSVDTDKRILYVEMPNDFAKNWIEERYAPLLTTTANQLLNEDYIIEFYTNQ